MTRLRTHISHEGQRFIDEPVYEPVSAPKPIAVAIADAFGAPPPAAKHVHVVGHERVWFRWMKGDGKGGFVPKKGGDRDVR